MAMAATEELKKEHEHIKLMLRVAREVCLRADREGTADPEHLEQILGFFTTFVDQYHHGKEEEILFPAMVEAGILKEGGPIGSVLADHQILRNFVQSMMKAHEKFKGGEAGGSSGFVGFALNYIDYFSRHIEKEEKVLFRLADERLTKERQDKLTRELNALESGKTPQGTREKSLKVLDQLKKIYLKEESLQAEPARE